MTQTNKTFQEDNFDFITFFFRLLKYWYVFVITGILSLGGAYLYSRFLTSIYQVNATIFIEEENTSLLDDNAFGGDAFWKKNTEAENEKAIIKSFSIVQETIKQLDFSVSYFKKDRYSQNELYKATPFIVDFDSINPQPTGTEFELQFISKDKFILNIESGDASLYSFSENKNTKYTHINALSKTFNFGDSIKSDSYNFCISKNPEYNFDLFFIKNNYKDDVYSFIFNNLTAQTLAYQAGTNVSLPEKVAEILALNIKGNNIHKITDYLNKLLEVYINNNLEKKNKAARNTIDFIDIQLSDISDSLQFAENSLQNFKSMHTVMDVSSQAEKIFDRLADLQKEKAGFFAKNKYYKYLLKSINDNSKYDDLMAPSTMGINDPLLNKLVAEMITLSTQKTLLLSNTSEKSPIIFSIESKINNAEQLILKNLSNIIKATDISISQVEDQIVDIEKEAKKLPKTQQRLFGFERKFKLNNEIFTFLLQKRAEAQITAAANLPDAEIIDKARTELATKKSMKHSVIYMIGLMIGMIIPAGVIYIRDLLNDKVMNKKDIGNITDIPLIGGIIQHKKANVKIFEEYPKSSIAESFRSVYTNLQYMLQGKTNNVILVTSVMQKEGKTFNAVNLASVFASFNKKTCLLSFDLRLPKIQKYFENDKEVGLSTYLINQSNIDEIIHKSEIDNLDVIFSGPIPPNPIELIASEKADELFAFLKSKYDTIIIDSPPIGIVADAVMLSKHSKTNVFITRQNHTKKKALSTILGDFNDEEKKKTSILFNGIKESRLYRYGYRYGYGYGYSNDYYDNKLNVKSGLSFLKSKFKNKK